MGVNLVPFVRNFFITHEDADEHSIQDGCITAGNHRLLRFDFLTQNIGNVDLNVGSPADHPEWFEKSASHGHYHLKNFNEFRLFSAPGVEIVKGYKQAFCLIDLQRVSPTASPTPKFTSCNSGQGVSAGWADIYAASLPCQFLVIDNVPDGDYVLRSTTNVPRYFSEDSFADNTICTGLHIQGDTVAEIPLPFLCDIEGVVSHWAIVAMILFGIVNDAGGLAWVPGRGPVPVDPWGPLSPAERDVLTAVAASRLATHIEDPAISRSMRAAAAEAVAAAARQMQHQATAGHH
jgi:lysyl oxidase